MGTPKKVFFSYSDYPKDLDLYSRLNTHFAILRKNKMVSIIDKNELLVLAPDKEGALRILGESDIAIPLISSDYFNNDECLAMLKEAVKNEKDIIPIFVRDVDLSGDDVMEKIKQKMIPNDGRSLLEHFEQTKDEDSVLKEISDIIKTRLFPELMKQPLKTGSTNFYYILAALELIIGIVAAVYVYRTFNDILLAILALLLFVCIAFLALKNVLFPTKLKA